MGYFLFIETDKDIKPKALLFLVQKIWSSYLSKWSRSSITQPYVGHSCNVPVRTLETELRSHQPKLTWTDVGNTRAERRDVSMWWPQALRRAHRLHKAPWEIQPAQNHWHRVQPYVSFHIHSHHNSIILPWEPHDEIQPTQNNTTACSSLGDLF